MLIMAALILRTATIAVMMIRCMMKMMDIAVAQLMVLLLLIQVIF